MQNNEKNCATASRDEDDANDYFMMQENQLIDDLKPEEIENVMNCGSDDEYDTNLIIHT